MVREGRTCSSVAQSQREERTRVGGRVTPARGGRARRKVTARGRPELSKGHCQLSNAERIAIRIPNAFNVSRCFLFQYLLFHVRMRFRTGHLIYFFTYNFIMIS